VACSTDLGQFHCGPGAPAPDPAETNAAEIATLRSYFDPPALYQATHDGRDCYKLTQARASATLPYGTSARFCFDPATGAIRILTQHLEGATDTFEATLVRGTVNDADFALNQNDDFGAPDDGTGTSTTTG
jgi:hypothetical protein